MKLSAGSFAVGDRRYLLAGLWLLVTSLLAFFSHQQWQRGMQLDADLFSLLPHQQQDPLVQKARQAAEAGLNRTTLLWIGSRPAEPLNVTVARAADTLNKSGLFSELLTGTPPANAHQLEPLLPWRFSLLAAEFQDQLRDTEGTRKFLEAYLERLSNPVAAGPIPLSMDAMGLLNQWLRNIPLNMPQVDPDNGLWVGKIGDNTGAFILLFNKSDAFTLEAPKQIADAIDALKRQEKEQGGEVLATGAAMFAATAARQAEREISTVGLGSTIAALALLLWVFRSARALLCLLPVAYGSWVALIGCQWVFEHVHLMTLVFGASLTGVSIDYAVHVMADAFQTKDKWSASKAMRKLLPGLTLGMLTSVLAYGLLAIAPFPGLQQIALFSGISLFSAYLMVILVFPMALSGFQRKHNPALLQLVKRSLAYRTHLLRHRSVLIVISALIAAVGLAQIRASDNIRQLYGIDTRLAQEDAAIRSAFHLNLNSQFLLLEAADDQALLLLEKQVSAKLDLMIKDGQLERYSAISQWLPDAATQHENLALLEQRIFSSQSPARRAFADIGIDQKILDKEWLDFQVARDHTLSIDEAIQLPIATPWRSLWLGNTAQGVASRISLQGATDINALTNNLKDMNGVRVVDPVATISNLLGEYRSYTLGLIVLALFAIGCFLVPRYGAKQAAQVVIAPATAVIVTLGLHGWLGLTFNLFSLFGFLIVLGMGVDYAIYFREAKDHLENTALGIALDVLTTLFSFGLLAVSSTPAVSAFGTSVLLGITFSWFFAYLVGDDSQNTQMNEANMEIQP